MKKAIIVSSLLSTMLLAGTVEIKTGWNNVGFSSKYSIQSLAESESAFKQIWYFDPVSKEWKFYSTSSSLMQTAGASDIGPIPEVLPFGSGVWIFSDSDVNLEVSGSSIATAGTFSSFKTTYFGDVSYAIGKKGDGFYIATSQNGSKDWGDFVPLDMGKNKSVKYSWNSALSVGENANDVIYGLVVQDSNNSSHEFAYVGTYNGSETSVQKVDEVQNGSIDLYYQTIFTSPDSNGTQYLFFRSYSWGENRREDMTIATNSDDNRWSFQVIENSDYYDINYNYIHRDNADSLRVLNRFIVKTKAPYKTILYGAKGGIQKTLELDGTWNSLMEFYSEEHCYVLLVKSDYASCCDRSGKRLALITDGSSVDHIDLDHVVRAVGMVSLNDSKKLFAFAHDEIGGVLYIYKSSDLGKSWSLLKEVADFEYQIKYVSSIREDGDGVVYCKLMVDDYSKYVESNDSFESWSVVTDSYRVVGANESGKYIERVEPNGSITLIERR